MSAHNRADELSLTAGFEAVIGGRRVSWVGLSSSATVVQVGGGAPFKSPTATTADAAADRQLLRRVADGRGRYLVVGSKPRQEATQMGNHDDVGSPRSVVIQATFPIQPGRAPFGEVG